MKKEREREEARHQGQASIIIIVLIWKLHSPVRCALSRPVSLESQPPSQHSRITRSMVTILQIKVRMMLIAPLAFESIRFITGLHKASFFREIQ